MTGRAFFSAISGLRNQQIKLDVIANNIANLNTFGFKSARVTFADLLSETLRAASSPTGGLAGTNPLQVGLGIKLSSIDTNTSQGSIQNTGNLTDLAINGEGMFIVTDGTNVYYTRAGNFTLDSTGTLIDANGNRVQGFTTLSADGTSISTALQPTDIQINFGQKLEARATENVHYRSNLDATSHTYGSAELQSAGSTGLTIAAGIMVPIAQHHGTIVDATFLFPDTTVTPGNDLVINGQTIEVTFDPGWSWGDPVANAQYVAEQINSQSTTVYARADTDGSLIIESLFGGGSDVTISGIPAYLTELGLTAGTYTAPAPSAALAGRHTIAVTDATNARDTSSTPVIAGALTPGSIVINGVTVSFSATVPDSTSAQNALHVATAINSTLGLNVTATANANGTITLEQDIPGANNIISIEDDGLGTLALLGLDTLGTFQANPTPPPAGYYIVDNGTNATISDIFMPDDGSDGYTRTFQHDAPAGIPSTLYDLGLLVLGENPPNPLIPGVVLTADELQPGQATVVTYDASEHPASIEVFDSLGNAHNLVITFKHIDENTWEWTADLPDEPNILLTNNTGVITFGENGLITSPNPTDPITFTPMGASNSRISPIFNGEGHLLEGVTQFGSETTTSAESQDGWPMGILQAFAFDTTGVLRGIFSNGLTRPLAQLALGLFSNPAGLQRAGENRWIVSANSGLAKIRPPGSGGVGLIIPGSLEQSNVDAASEFTELIIAQRSYQANSRVITIQSQLLEDVINLIR